MPSPRIGRIVSALMLASSVACASAPAGSSTPESQPVTRERNVISSQELRDPALAGLSLTDAIRRLRPHFLNEGSGLLRESEERLAISVNGSSPSSPNELERLTLADVAEVRLLSIPEAAQRFGLGGTGTRVLLISLKSSR